VGVGEDPSEVAAIGPRSRARVKSSFDVGDGENNDL
jgi:hypothetical protein